MRHWRILQYKGNSLEIIETPTFTKFIMHVLPENEYSELQWALIENPYVGDLIPGGTGLRKVRCSTQGRGRRSGIRVIYYLVIDGEKIYMLYAYKKSRISDLTKAQIKQLTKYIRENL